MLRRLEIYRKAIAAGLVAVLGVAAQVAPILGSVDPAAIQAVAGFVAVAVVYLVPNTRGGQSVDYLASVLLDIAESRSERAG